MIERLRRRLGRLRVAQRLALLVLVPLVAVVGLAIPVVIDRGYQASAAATVADEARTRRIVGVLLEELQRERLLSLVYLSQAGAEPSPVVRQSQAVNDAIESVRTSADPRLRPGVTALTELLNQVRPRVLDRSVLSLVAHTIFSQGIAAVLDAMPPPRAANETASVPPAAALDELLRANEQAARFGAAVLVMATEPAGDKILADARTAQALYTTHFTQLAKGEHRQLLTNAENSQASRRVTELAEAIGTPGDVNVVIGRVAAAVETYTTLRRLVGDRIAREIVDDADRAANGARTAAILVGVLALLLLLIVAGLAAAGARSIALPLARLNEAAVAVAAATGQELERVSDVEDQAEAAPTLRAVPTTGPGDVADLAVAFNQVQEGAAALLARQVTTRRNVSAMFATVARRTRNLADRQLNLIDVLERQQQDPQLLDRLYRLDHVATRLRRSASALLVVSGAADDPTGNPMRLADIVRAAAAEIEQFTRVQLVDAVDVAAVPRAVPDLILLVAELLDNAVSYSPPPAPVEVRVGFSGGGCRVSISDVGIGMSPDQLAAENQRLVDRERLDIAPTQVLGLFVVGRLARRHGLTVTLTPNQPQGITVVIDLPGRLLTAAVGPTAPAPQPRGMRQAVRRTTQLMPVPDRTSAAMRRVAEEDPFDWFHNWDGPPMLPAAQPAAELPSAGTAPPPTAPATIPEPLVRPSAAQPIPMPAAPPAAIPMPAAPPAAIPMPAAPPRAEPARPEPARAKDSPTETPLAPVEARSGLSRRIPGRNLPSGTPLSAPRDPAPAEAAPIDPAAARAEAEAFTQGFARGVASVPGSLQSPPDAPPPAGVAAPAVPSPAVPPPPAPPQWPLTPPVPAQRQSPSVERIDADGVGTGPIGTDRPAAASAAAPAGADAVPADADQAEPLRVPPQRAAERIEPVSAAPDHAAPVSGAPVSPAPMTVGQDSPAPVSAAPMSAAPVSPAPAGPPPDDSDRYPLPLRRSPAASSSSGPAPAGTPTGTPSTGRPADPAPTGGRRDPEITLPIRVPSAWPQPPQPPQPPRPAGPARPAPAVPQPVAAAATTGADEETTLTRRVPGSHLADELKVPGAVPAMPAGMPLAPGPAHAPVDRDPDAEQHELDALVAGFARGAAAVQAGNGGSGRPGTSPNAGPTVQFPTQDPSPTFQFNSGTPNGAEPQNVERR